LETEPPFDHYLFIEQAAERVVELQRLRRSLRMRSNPHCHTRRWVNSSTPSCVSSCTGYFGIGNTSFVRIFSATQVSIDVYGTEPGLIPSMRMARCLWIAAGGC
jgi:hypothetical protein